MGFRTKMRTGALIQFICAAVLLTYVSIAYVGMLWSQDYIQESMEAWHSPPIKDVYL